MQEIAKFESFGQVLIKTKNDKKRKVVVVTLKSLDRTPFFLELWQSKAIIMKIRMKKSEQGAMKLPRTGKGAAITQSLVGDKPRFEISPFLSSSRGRNAPLRTDPGLYGRSALLSDFPFFLL